MTPFDRMRLKGSAHRNLSAFTLLETIVAGAVLLLMIGLLLSVTNATRSSIGSATDKAATFRSARAAFDAVTRTLSQATLNTYWDYYDADDRTRPADDPTTVNVDESLNFNPVRYGRASDLRFISGNVQDLGVGSPFNGLPSKSPSSQPNGQLVTGAIFFQAPTGFRMDKNGPNAHVELAETALNTIGYFIDYNKDALFEPAILPSPSESMRFRLMEFREPANALRVFSKTSGDPGYDEKDWFTESLTDPEEGPVYTRVLAENVIAMVLLPKLSSREAITELDPWGLAPEYLYDSATRGQDTLATVPLLNSKHQLPPIVEVVMVALDEESARRLNEISNNDPIRFLGLDNLFQDASKLYDGDPSDLAQLEAQLNTHGLTYRVFSTEVLIKAAKWSLQ